VTLDSIDLTLWLAGIIMDAVLLGLVVWRRVYRTLPVFFFYLVWCLSSEPLLAVARQAPNAYLPATDLSMTVVALFQLAILAELGRVVVRHNHVSPPSRTVIVLLTALACVIAGSLNKWTFPAGLSIFEWLNVVLTQLFAVLRVVFLLTLVWWSSLLGLNWPTRELRIVTGLGFYIMAAFSIAILHTHNMAGMQYHWLDQLLAAGYLWTLSYWILASTTKVAEQQ
jgi:hypothetical protein